MSRTRAAILLGLASAAAVVAACGSFSGSDSSDSTDAAADATSPDATASTDAGTSDARDASLRFCITQDAQYCTDFDTPNLPYGPFAPASPMDASFTLTSDSSVSPPSAMIAAAAPQFNSKGDSFSQAVLGLSDVTLGQGRRVEFDVRIVDANTSGIILQIFGRGDGGIAGSGAYLYADPMGNLVTGSFFTDGGVIDSGVVVTAVQDSPWIHIVVDIVKMGTGGAVISATAKVGATQLPTSNPIPLPGTYTSIELAVGSQAARGSPSFRVELDNVVVR